MRQKKRSGRGVVDKNVDTDRAPCGPSDAVTRTRSIPRPTGFFPGPVGAHKNVPQKNIRALGWWTKMSIRIGHLLDGWSGRSVCRARFGAHKNAPPNTSRRGVMAKNVDADRDTVGPSNAVSFDTARSSSGRPVSEACRGAQKFVQAVGWSAEMSIRIGPHLDPNAAP